MTSEKQDGSAGKRPRIRLDKWLWCARFFKTRALASTAVNGGKVHVNGVRAKPAHEIHVGERLEITCTPDRYEVVVCALSEVRGPASLARTLYEETVSSIATRNRHAELRRLAALSSPAPAKRPDKKSRRLIHRFKHGV